MSTVLQKMRINPPHVLCKLNAPAEFEKGMGKLPADISIINDTKEKFDSLHWFVRSKAVLDSETAKVLKLLKPGVTVWCYYPKGTSKIQTDLTRDKGWDTLLKEDLKWISLISFDDTWSTFAFRLKSASDKEEVPKEREIFKYADPTTKTVKLPEDVEKAFSKNKKAKSVYEALAYSHRREYIEWIITAKREETRTNRVNGMMKMLVEGKKNPQDR